MLKLTIHLLLISKKPNTEAESDIERERERERTCVFLCECNNSFDVGVTLEHCNGFLRRGNDCLRFLRGGGEGNEWGQWRLRETPRKEERSGGMALEEGEIIRR